MSAGRRVLSLEQCRDVETKILSNARNKTTGQLRRIVDRAVISADPDAANARHEAARKDRDVTVRPIEDGMALLAATLTIEEAATAERVISELAGKRKRRISRSDAFMRPITGDIRPVATGKPLIQVIVPASTLLGLDE